MPSLALETPNVALEPPNLAPELLIIASANACVPSIVGHNPVVMRGIRLDARLIDVDAHNFPPAAD